jgi:hypothetical protein
MSKPTPPEQAARDLAQDYIHTFASDAGKRVLADLAHRFREEDPSFVPNLEPWQPAYRDGAKSVIKFIRHQLNTTPNTNLTPTVKK